MAIASTLAALVITISAHPSVPSSLVDRVLAEADAIWAPAGLAVTWSRQLVPASALYVFIGPARGTSRDGNEPLGWILFDSELPRPEIYVSYANVVSLLQSSRGVVGNANTMPTLERDLYLSRALGRALAHEIGHYLLASKEHTKRGLMKATRTAFEFFGADRDRFAVTAAQRALIESRLAVRLADAAPPPPPHTEPHAPSPRS